MAPKHPAPKGTKLMHGYTNSPAVANTAVTKDGAEDASMSQNTTCLSL